MNGDGKRFGTMSLAGVVVATDAIDVNVERIYLTVLSRRPTPAEAAEIASYVGSASPPVQPAGKGKTKVQPRDPYADIFWALLNSAEFALNR